MFCITRLSLTLGVVLVLVGADTIPTYEVPHPALTSAAISHGEGAKASIYHPSTNSGLLSVQKDSRCTEVQMSWNIHIF